MGTFKIESKFKPTGDQPEAIDKLVDSLNKNNKFNTQKSGYWANKHKPTKISNNKLQMGTEPYPWRRSKTKA